MRNITASLESDKENMATPGRRGKRGGGNNQYFDVGKLGRKTGIELKDTGIRDEHGLEPVSGIFSSPVSPPRDIERLPTSEDMDLQDSSAPDVERTLNLRKTPRLPPARQSTPKHTNIGSPKRASSAKPSARRDAAMLGTAGDSPSRIASHRPPNRVLDFTGALNRNRKSVNILDNSSPFKPKKVLRRSGGHVRQDIFALDPALEAESSTAAQERANVDAAVPEEEVEQSIEDVVEAGDGPLVLDNDDHYEDPEQDQISDTAETTQALSMHDMSAKRSREGPRKSDQSVTSNQPSAKRQSGRPRGSDQSPNSSQIDQTAVAAAIMSPVNGQKRNRDSLEGADIATDGENTIVVESSSATRKRRKGRISNAAELVVHHDDEPNALSSPLLANGDSYTADLQEDYADAQPVQEAVPEVGTRRPGRPKGKKNKAAAPKERDPNRAMRRSASPTKQPLSQASRGGSVGPVSNVNLRATTPFDDAGHQTSRSGRNLMKPLEYWNNEGYIYKNGEVEGIIRADKVETLKSKTKKKRRRGKQTQLGVIDEESETESILPDEWEDDLGVITGHIAAWDPVLKMGDTNKPLQEDLAFAASSIVTRDVAGSEFKYAKIMTVPFFGAGLVEIPPEGFKRAKNSRKMQMIFFVHEGKVTVDVGANGMEVNQFALSKGGAWVVPRGNNYAITNESRTVTAKVFFAQGCVVESEEEQR